ncbi:hypothetical protein [Phytohabitans aurantiacus]|uniref:Uncharacterized protein n=1 Tax=Phytohabitans aurantiacus TaxID=3016789 RepID=A0ABQ5R931_9ACTN|nr:hypothetical protein [Phytohabitans aurantiacus]GLI02465.1 hypothetical protein Pa4123_77430 [Phytohabitans aurantiacus]
MPFVVTLRNLGTAAIVIGLLITLLTLASAGSDRPFVLAVLIVLIGIGLRIEAALAATAARQADPSD